MGKALIITPVKNSLQTARETIISICKNKGNRDYIVYNDFSDEDTEAALKELKNQWGFELKNLSDMTRKPSPNYDLVLEDAQRIALESGRDLIIIESDITIRKDTLDKLEKTPEGKEKIGLVGAVTVDEEGKVTYPHLKFKKLKEAAHFTKRSLSFCCTLITNPFLREYLFKDLDHSKDWFDIATARKALELGYKNIILRDVPVVHKPHSSRPWKQLKRKNIFRYYWLKWTKGMDKI